MKPLSTLQHKLMDFLLGKVQLKVDEVTDTAQKVIDECYVLEKKYAGVNY